MARAPRSTVRTLALLALLLSGGPVRSSAAAQGGPPYTLDDVFAEPGDLFDRPLGTGGFEEVEDPLATLPNCEGTGAQQVDHRRFVVRGGTFTGFHRSEWDGLDADCGCGEPLPAARTVSSHLVLDVILPGTDTFLSDPANGLSPNVIIRRGDVFTDQGKRMAAIELAKRGIPTVLWEELNTDDDEIDDRDSVARQLGYLHPGQLQPASFRWMMRHHEESAQVLTLEALRFDYRYMAAQNYILAHTFFRGYVAQRYGSAGDLYVQNLKSVFSGGSKHAGGAMTAAGAENRAALGGPNRARGMIVNANQGWDASNQGGFARYQSDWGFTAVPGNVCPYASPPSNPCTDWTHLLAPFALWTWNQRCESTNYFDVYAPSEDPVRYRDLMVLDITQTHDPLFPLGSSQRIWFTHNGLDPSGTPSSEFRGNYRLQRSPNKGHGQAYEEPLNGVTLPDCCTSPPCSYASGGQDYRWAVEDLLLMQMMRQLRDPNEVQASPTKNWRLPRLDAYEASLTSPPAGNWTFRFREGNLRRVSQGGGYVDETASYLVHYMLSDDRDLRRCGTLSCSPAGCRAMDIECLGGSPAGQLPCPVFGVDPTDSYCDDNKDVEDHFEYVVPTNVARIPDGSGGYFVTLTFPKPDYTGFAGTPMAAVVVEAKYPGPLPSALDDMVLTTEVVFANAIGGFVTDSCP